MAIMEEVLNLGEAPLYASPLQLTSRWEPVGDPLYLADPPDSAALDDPLSIDDSRRQIFSRGNRPATVLQIRMRWAIDGGDPADNPVLRVYGRTNSGGVVGDWQYIRNDGSTPFTPKLFVNTPVDDCITSAGDRVTTPTVANGGIMSVDGCNEFLIGVEGAFTATAGDITIAALEVRFL